MKSFKVRNVDQRPNLRHLWEPLRGTEGLIETVGFEKTTERMWWRTSANASREWVPNWGAAMLKPREANVVWTRRAKKSAKIGFGDF